MIDYTKTKMCVNVKKKPIVLSGIMQEKVQDIHNLLLVQRGRANARGFQKSCRWQLTFKVSAHQEVRP